MTRRVLLTGAAGYLGVVLRRSLCTDVELLRSSDIVETDGQYANEEIVLADLTDPGAVDALVQGVDAIVHFGGVSTDRDFQSVYTANILGTQHLYEAARAHRVKRIVFASSVHAVGFYKQTEVIDSKVPLRPDSFYGLSKAFGESLAQLYWDKHQLETVSIRIGSCLPAPKDRRHLYTWLSFDDLCLLVKRALSAARVEHTIVYGMSKNSCSFWDNRQAQHLGYRAKASADIHLDSITMEPHGGNLEDVAVKYQGGVFAR
ncbi:NAD(P)-dependent oxidoreductase [Mesorhizobium sp. SB112]|uniref:NAD-dependent epimerase/dehydratase family protein n=1 Tax=Mesorhizobium sp. SB112 TaxID=3151853 RepID=UPI003267F0B3